MNTAATTRDALWSGVHTAVDSNAPSDLGQHLKDANGAAAMDIDSDTATLQDTTRTQAPAGPDIASTPAAAFPPSSSHRQPHSKLPSSSDPSTDGLLHSLGAAADDLERLDVRAPPAAASLAWQPKPDGSVTLRPAVAAMADADDPGEDDVDRLQADDYEYDDDVAAVGGDIMGVGPTYGTVAGDPTQNLGGLGPQLQQQLLNSMDQRQRHDNINNDDGAAGTRSSAGGMLSEGDADVRGRKGISVHEDADMGLRQQGAAAVAAGSTGGGSRALSGVEGGVMAGGDEYSPEGLDVLDAGAIASGDDFVSQPYIRHRSAGHTGMDPDPRQRPDPNPKRGLGLEGGSTAHPVDRSGDFAMGTVAIPAFGADAAAVRGLEYSDEPKYAGEVEVNLQEGGAAAGDDDMAEEGVLGKAAAASGSTAAGVTGGGTAALAGNPDNGSADGASDVADVGSVAGCTDVEGSGPVLLQQVGVGQLQQGRIAAATAAQPSSATDARHLGAIFGGDPFGT